MRLNYLEPCLQLACETNLFEWALEIAKHGTMDQKKEVHYRYAMALEDEGRFAEAEKEFIQAGKSMEAVQMYIHSREWESAEEIARSHSQEAVAQVLIARAAEAAEAQDYATAETVLLRAHKPELIIEHYKVHRCFVIEIYADSCNEFSEKLILSKHFLSVHILRFS